MNRRRRSRRSRRRSRKAPTMGDLETPDREAERGFAAGFFAAIEAQADERAYLDEGIMRETYWYMWYILGEGAASDWWRWTHDNPN